MTEETSGTDLLALATELTTAWLANPNTRVSADEVPAFLKKMHGTVAGLVTPASVEENIPETQTFAPAVTVRRSLASKDHIISMIDGRPYKTLKRHLSTHGLTPAGYRERYGLKPDYPMVSEAYGAMRRDLAKKIGLGRKPGQKPAAKTATKPTGTSGAAAKTKPTAKPKAAVKPKNEPAPSAGAPEA